MEKIISRPKLDLIVVGIEAQMKSASHKGNVEFAPLERKWTVCTAIRKIIR